MGDFLVASTAKLDMTIDTTAAASGAAIARRNVDSLNFFMLHPSSLSQVVRVMS